MMRSRKRAQLMLLQEKRVKLGIILRQTEKIDGVREGTIGDYDAKTAEIKIYIKSGANVAKVSREVRKLLSSYGISSKANTLTDWKAAGRGRSWFSATVPYAGLSLDGGEEDIESA